MKRILHFTGILIALFLTNTAIAQHRWGLRNTSQYNYWSLGITANAINYVGDLDPSPFFISPAMKFTRPDLGIVGSYRVNSRMFVRSTLSWGQIAGSDVKNSGTEGKDRFRRVRNLSFRNNIFELKADVVVNLFNNMGKPELRPDFTPYAFLGIAVFTHNPQAEYNGEWHDLQPLSTEGQNVPGIDKKSYGLVQVAVPAGIGFKYKLGKKWDLSFEIGWRFTTTDYLDDVGSEYADPALLQQHRGNLAVALADRSVEGYQSGTTTATVEDLGLWNGSDVSGYGQAGDQRGDLKGRNDWYIVTGFQLTRILHRRNACPKFDKNGW